jgi:2-polyprenyl-3-methyl-5-hydroxy-6-metoxy-1,4-benzoquinol methylase
MNHCPICNHRICEVKYKLTFDVYQCKNCGFQFCPDATFDKSFKSDLNEESRAKALIGLRKDNFQKIISSVKQFAVKNPKGLEVGCGYGWFLESCKDNAIECSGIEPETRFNNDYKQKGFNVSNGFYPADLPGDSKFDFIAFNDVLEHIPAVDSIMDANYNFLNPNGLLILNLPVQGGIVYFIARIAYCFGVKSLLNRMWQFNFHSPHISYFTRKNLLDFVAGREFRLMDSYKLKTVKLSEISSRIKQDNKQNYLRFFVTYTGTLFLYPFFSLFPDTYCFVFRRK